LLQVVAELKPGRPGADDHITVSLNRAAHRLPPTAYALLPRLMCGT
jgi:hypothetical protein